ncbi:MAG: CBS domain-containing protein [Arenicellales bacterium]|nr:CBS domain-containing protein [Arenicellales bacterium]
MTAVAKLLDSKERHIWSIGPNDFVYDAIKLMAEKGIGALLVMEGGSLVGILSERDYARKVILKGKSSKKTPVVDIMTKDVLFARPEQNVEECMALMTKKHIRHLPVMEGKQVVGMISIGDLVKTIIAEQKFTIEQLEHYISG